MNRKILLLISTFALGSAPFIIGGCSSGDEKAADEASMSDDGLDGAELSDDGAASANPDSTADVSGTPADGTPTDGGNSDDIVADLGDDPTAEGAASDPGADALPDQALGNDTPPPTDVADNNVPPPADSMTNDAPTPGEGDMAAPPPLGADTSMPTTPRASLKKVKDTPFKSGGRILNTVYVARKGDTLNKVAEKLFGDKKRKKELIADNSMLSRGVKQGDKIYYNSPRRPDDTTTMMNYFEDNGIPAQSYITKDGDNLKNVAKELLGSREGWKELWVTNPNLESKGNLDSNTEIRYWSQAPDTTVAANTPPPSDMPPPPPPIVEGTTTPPSDLNNLPPPSDSLPPPPPAPSDTAALPPPPPPPDQNVAANNEFPPPPPPPPGLNVGPGKKPASPESFLFQDQETTMALGAGAIILLSVLLIIVHRIKRGRAQRMRLGQTQV